MYQLHHQQSEAVRWKYILHLCHVHSLVTGGCSAVSNCFLSVRATMHKFDSSIILPAEGDWVRPREHRALILLQGAGLGSSRDAGAAPTPASAPSSPGREKAAKMLMLSNRREISNVSWLTHLSKLSKKNPTNPTQLERWRKEIKGKIVAEGLVSGLVCVWEGSQTQMGAQAGQPVATAALLPCPWHPSALLGTWAQHSETKSKRTQHQQSITAVSVNWSHVRTRPEGWTATEAVLLGVALPLLVSPGEEVLGSFPDWGKLFLPRSCLPFSTSPAQVEEMVVGSVDVQRCFYLLFALKEQNAGLLSNSELL